MGKVILGRLKKMEVAGQKIQGSEIVNRLGNEGWELVTVEHTYLPLSGFN